ncbi:MAG TPA: hypothetical protein DCQ06_03690 [Myxococcales bacterium]|nr:hypothetical protein [Myxococcales bacterium]
MGHTIVILTMSVALTMGLAACGGDESSKEAKVGGQVEADVATEMDASSAIDAKVGTDSVALPDVSLDVGEFGGVTKPTEILEINGLWRIGSNAQVQLTSKRFGKVVVVHYDNANNKAYTTAPVGVSGPGGVVRQGVYSVYQWTEPTAGRARLCQVDTNLNTEEAALQSANTANEDEPQTGCNGGPWITLDTPELSGVWASSFGGNEVITALELGTVSIIEWDNDKNVLYTQNPQGIGASSSLYNRIVWTEFAAGPAWYCKVDVGLKSLDEAKASTKTADDSDPDVSGCNGFGWTKLTPLAARGSYATTGGNLTHVTSHNWDERILVGFDNDKRVAWLRNHSEADVHPNRFARMVWTPTESSGHFWACLTDDGLSDLQAAQDSEKATDDSDPTSGGCNGGPWKRYTRVATP